MQFNKFFLYKSVLLSLALLSSSCQNKLEQRQKDAAKAATPYNPLVRIADSMNDSQDYSTAIKLYRQALDMDSKDISAQMGLAQSLAAIGQYKKAIETLELVLATREHTGALQELGKIYLVSNEADKCIGAYSRVLNRDGQNIAALNGQGVCHDIKGEHQKAQNLYNRALALSPDHFGVKSNLGLSLVLEKNYAEGIPILSEIANRSEASQRDRQNLAIALGLSGDVEQAAQLFSVDLKEEDVRRNLAMFHVYTKAEKNQSSLALAETGFKETAPEEPESILKVMPEDTPSQEVAQVLEVY